MESSIEKESAKAVKALCPLWGLRRVHGKVDRALKAELTRFSISPMQFHILGKVIERNEITERDLCFAFGANTATMKRSLEWLRKERLIEYGKFSRKGRHIVRITNEGRKTFLRAYEVWADSRDHLMSLVRNELAELS